MRNSEPIAYKGMAFPSAYIEMGGTIGTIRIATESLNQTLNKDGLDDEDVPREVADIDNQIAYYVTDEEFQLPVKDVKKIVRIAYDEKEPVSPSAQKTIRELKKGEFFRLKDTETSPVWIRDVYVPELRKYSTYKFDNVNHELARNGDTKVFTGFTF